MRRSSFSIDILPQPSDESKGILVVKWMDVENGHWGEVHRLLDTYITIDLNDIPPEQIHWVAVTALQQGLRRFAATISPGVGEGK